MGPKESKTPYCEAPGKHFKEANESERRFEKSPKVSKIPQKSKTQHKAKKVNGIRKKNKKYNFLRKQTKEKFFAMTMGENISKQSLKEEARVRDGETKIEIREYVKDKEKEALLCLLCRHKNSSSRNAVEHMETDHKVSKHTDFILTACQLSSLGETNLEIVIAIMEEMRKETKKLEVANNVVEKESDKSIHDQINVRNDLWKETNPTKEISIREEEKKETYDSTSTQQNSILKTQIKEEGILGEIKVEIDNDLLNEFEQFCGRP